MATVLFCPGFGGSVLRHLWPTFTGYRDVWIQPDVLLASGLEILALNSQGTGPRFAVLPNLVAGTAIPLYYPAVLNFLTARGWTLDVLRTDWRRPLAFNAATVAGQVRTVARREGPVRLVGHSRGGLMIGAALQVLAGSGDLGMVQQVVTLCTPHGGSYAPVPWLAGWPWKADAAMVLFIAAGITLLEALLRRQVSGVCRTFPGLYELLPDPARAAAAGDLTAQGLYDQASWDRSRVPVNAAHLGAAHLRWLNAPPWPVNVRTTCIVGTGIPTVCTSVALGALDVPGCLQGTVDGDGVVPAWSATVAGLPGVALPVSHQGVISDVNALATLHMILAS